MVVICKRCSGHCYAIPRYWINNPVLTGVGNKLGGTAISPQDANISELGKEVTKQGPEFDGKAKIKFDATVSWQRGKGFKLIRGRHEQFSVIWNGWKFHFIDRE